MNMRKDLKKFIELDKQQYLCLRNKRDLLYSAICHDRDYMVYRFTRYLRKTEYYFEKKSRTKVYYIPYIYYKRINWGKNLDLI